MYPPMDDAVLASPKMVPEKFGAISNPLPKYPAVTAPLRNSWKVKIITDHVRSYPINTCAIIKNPGVIVANVVNILRVCVTVNVPLRSKRSAKADANTAIKYLPR